MCVRVPNALIRRVCYPTSYRLPKMPPRLEFPKKPEEKPVVPHIPVRSTFAMRGSPPHLVDISGKSPAVVMDYGRGNLPNDEYRFFIGYPAKQSTVSVCRWCTGRFETEAARKAHKESDCKRNLISLYQRLRLDKLCVVCDVKTHREYWGLPLCSDACEQEYRFAVPDSMKFEISRLQAIAGERMAF